ncbi:MAG: tetratricopeptide repeat protein [Polyangiaceae bacterium]|jgi:hypothetical protein
MRARLGLSVLLAALVASVAIPARADGVLPAAATPVQREQAQARFARGKELLAKKQYEAALAEFRASHEIVGSPNTRLELARCLRAMGKLVAAYAELGRAAVEAKELVGQDNRYQRAFDSASSERAEIEPQLGFATLTIQNATDDTKVIVGGEELRRAAWGEPTPVIAGDTEVVLETPGHTTVKRTLTLAAGQKTTLTVDALSGDPAPAPPPPPEATAGGSGTPPLRLAAYVAGGVGVAGLATFTIAGIMARSTYNDLNGACQGGPCPPDKTGEISSGKTQQTIANVGLIVGIAGVAAGVTLFVLSPSKATTAPATGVVVAPGWMGVHGTF